MHRGSRRDAIAPGRAVLPLAVGRGAAHQRRRRRRSYGRRPGSGDGVETLQAFHEIELHRLRGELLIARGAAHHDEAAHHLRRAIDLARGQDARSYELRASIALARLIREDGRPSEARALLAPIYASFTEGHDTPDLQAASELLTSLAT